LKHLTFPALLFLWVLALSFGLCTRPGIRGNVIALGTHTLQAEIQPGLLHAYTLVLMDSDELASIIVQGRQVRTGIGTARTTIQIPIGLKRLGLICETRHNSNPRNLIANLPLPERPWIHLLPFILISILFLYHFLHTRISPGQAEIFSLSALAASLWSVAIPWSQFSWDAYGHREYIYRILATHSIPPSNACSLCYHPPLYHILAAFVLGAAQTIGLETGRILEILSLGMVLTGIWFGLEAIRILFPASTAHPLQWIFSFCPQIWMLSGRLNNDVLIFCLGSLSFFYWVRSAQLTSNNRYLIFAGIAAGLMCWTKGNGLLWVVMLAWMAGTWDWKERGVASAIILLVTAFPFMVLGIVFSGARSRFASHGGDLVIGNIADQYINGQSFPLHFTDLWRIHLSGFLNSPFYAAQDTKYFLNTVIKSLAFGEVQLLPYYLNIFGYPGLVIISLLIIEFIRICLRCPHRILSWGPVCALGFVALAMARLRYPFPTSQDPRYVVFLIYPILLGLSSLDTRKLQRYARYWVLIFGGIEIIAITFH